MSCNIARDAFVAFCVKHKEPEVAGLLQEWKACEEELAEVERKSKEVGSMRHVVMGAVKYFPNRTRAINLRGRLRHLQERVKAISSFEGFQKQYDEIRIVPRIVDVRIDQDVLVVDTEPLFGRSWNMSWHRVGPYRITYNPREAHLVDRIRWINQEGPIRIYVSDDQRGHVLMTSFGADMQGRRTCFGNAEEPLREAAARHDYVAIASILVRFPESAGQHNYIERWPCVQWKELPEWYRLQFPQ